MTHKEKRLRRLYLRPSIIRTLTWVVVLSSLLVCVYVWMGHYYDHQIRTPPPSLYLTINRGDSRSLKRREILTMTMTEPESRSIFETLGNSQVDVNDFDLSTDTSLHFRKQPQQQQRREEEEKPQLWPDMEWRNRMANGELGLGSEPVNFLSDTLDDPMENGQTSPMMFVDPAITTPLTQNVDLHGTTTSRPEVMEDPEQVKKLFSDRLDKVDSYCQKKSRLQKGLKSMWIQYKNTQSKTNSSRKKLNVQWCPLYKAASSPWMALFMKLKNVLSPKTEQMIHHGKMTFVKLAKMFHLDRPRPPIYPSEKERVRQNKDFNISMIVVRHPFERILSAFRDKLERLHGRSFYNKKYSLGIIKRFRPKNQWRESITVPLMTLRMTEKSHNIKKGTGPTTYYYDKAQSRTTQSNKNIIPTFNEFVQFLITSAPITMDEHWRPFFIDCNPCLGTKFNLILKVESMDRDRDYFLNLLGISPTPISLDNYDNYNNETMEDDYTQVDKVWKRWTNSVSWNETSLLKRSQVYFSQVSKKNLRKLYKLYEPDFQMFGYSPDEYIAQGHGK